MRYLPEVHVDPQSLRSFPTRRSSDLAIPRIAVKLVGLRVVGDEQIRPAVQVVVEQGHAQRLGAGIEQARLGRDVLEPPAAAVVRSEEHTSELQSLRHLVCRLLLEKKK